MTLLPPFEIEYSLVDTYPNVRIKAMSSGDVVLRVQLSESKSDAVVLYVDYGPSRVSFVDLVGNGPGLISEGRHQKGYGTLLVNLAIQVVRQASVVNSQTPVHGTITDERPEVADFWCRFGMTVSKPNPLDGSRNGNGQITGRFGDVSPVSRAYKAGGILDLSLDISRFRVVTAATVRPQSRTRVS